MPASSSFTERLFPKLPHIIQHFQTPFHIYDEQGILETIQTMQSAFQKAGIEFNNYFAVKATPNPKILSLIHQAGFGFDCSSVPELQLARLVGAQPNEIIFTSNNTSAEEFQAALAENGCIINLDDFVLIDKLAAQNSGKLPELICFRYNPGADRKGNAILGNPEEAKYGLRDDQILYAYLEAKRRGSKRFGIHTMIVSNQLNMSYMAETVKMMSGLTGFITKFTGIQFEFINVGGGIGIPYRPEDEPFNLMGFVFEAAAELERFQKSFGYKPKLFMECGRYITGPHGVLVTKVINRMRKYREYVGVDACMSSLMRPAMYDAYHHITILDSTGVVKKGWLEIVDVVGALCENNDKFAKQRELPATKEGDIVVIHDTGAHGLAMGFQYNGRLRPKELLLRADNSVELIRREETSHDYFRPMLEFKADLLKL